MVDSTCVMTSLFPSSNKQGDANCALAQSVSFGRYMNQTLEWDKFSSFNQNRYLEEAQRLAKPGLVAQRKALFEAHFNKPGTEKVTDFVTGSHMSNKSEARVIRNDINKENYNKPLKDMPSAKPMNGVLSKAAKSRTDALWGVNHPQDNACIGPLSEKVDDSVKDDSIAVFKPSAIILVKTDGSGSDLTGGASMDFEGSHNLDSLHDTSDLDYMVAEPNPSEKIYSISGFTSPVPVSLDKIVIQEHMDKFVLASTADSESAFSSSNISSKKHAVLTPCKLRSQELPMKKNNGHENSMSSYNGRVTRKKAVAKPLDVPINQKSSCPVIKNPLIVKELDNVKYHVNTRGLEVHSDQVRADIDRQAKTTTSLKALSSNRKLSAEPDLRQAPTQLKRRMNFPQVNMASMRKSVVQKETYKWNTTKSVSTSSDTNMGKHTVPSSNTSAFGRKLKIQSHANSDSHTKYGSKSIQVNSALISSQNTLKKSLPKAVNMSVGTSCTFESVKWPKTAPNSGSSRITANDARVSKESSYHAREFLQKSMRTSAALHLDDKGRKKMSTRLHDPSSGIKTTKRPPITTTTVFTPFRFRSDERAAIRKQKLEFRSSAEDTISQIKRKGSVLSHNNNPLASSTSSNNNKR